MHHHWQSLQSHTVTPYAVTALVRARLEMIHAIIYAQGKLVRSAEEEDTALLHRYNMIFIMSDIVCNKQVSDIVCTLTRATKPNLLVKAKEVLLGVL